MFIRQLDNKYNVRKKFNFLQLLDNRLIIN
mgnify:CR=1 FL=1